MGGRCMDGRMRVDGWIGEWMVDGGVDGWMVGG